MRIEDVLRQAVTVESDDTIVTAARRMRDANASSCVVLGNGRIVGSVNERDLVTKLVAENRTASEVFVGDLMTATDGDGTEQVRGRLVDLLGTPAWALEDAESVYELALTGAPLDLSTLPGGE